MTVRPAVAAAVFAICGVLTFAQAPAPAQTPPPIVSTPAEIFLAPFKDGTGKTIRIGFLTIQKTGFEVGKPSNITNSPGDDDQPCFLPDSSGLLFSSNRDGKQRDIYRYDIAAKTVTQITTTAEDEFSPMPAPDGRTFSAVRGADRQLSRFNLDRSDAGRESIHPGPIGDHAWMSATQIAAFVRAPQAAPDVLHLLNLSTGAQEILESSTGRALHVRSRTGTLTFMHTSRSGDSVIEEFNPVTKKIEALSPAVENSEDFLWTSDGGLIMGTNSKRFLREDDTDRWIEIADLQKSGVTAISRVAMSPDGKWIAIVSAPKAK